MPAFVPRPILRRVHDAFRLRAALLPLLARTPLDEADHVTFATASESTWKFVLRAECCALAVAAALRRSGLRELLTPAARDEVDSAELRELQRVVAVRGVLRTVDGMSQRVGASPIVVKGAVAAMDPERSPVDLGDIDLLVGRMDARVLWNALRDAGWTPASEGLSPYDSEAAARNHFAPLLPPGVGLPIELHQNLDYGDVPSEVSPTDAPLLEGCRSLRRLSGREALVTSLRHTVLKHPFRRGHLRDLVSLSDEAASVGDRDFRDLERMFASDRYAEELTEMLRQIEAIRTHRRPSDSRATRRFVAWKYASLLRANWAFREWLPGWTSISFRALERPATRRVEYRKLFRYGFRPVPADSPLRRTATGRRISPSALRIARTTYRLTLTFLLVLSAWYLRRAVDALIDAGADAPPDRHESRNRE